MMRGCADPTCTAVATAGSSRVWGAGAQLLGATSSVAAGDGGGGCTLLLCFVALGLSEPLHDGAPPLRQGMLAYGVAAWALAIVPVGVIAEVGGVKAILLAHARAPSVCARLAHLHRRCCLSAAAQCVDLLYIYCASVGDAESKATEYPPFP